MEHYQIMKNESRKQISAVFLVHKLKFDEGNGLICEA